MTTPQARHRSPKPEPVGYVTLFPATSTRHRRRSSTAFSTDSAAYRRSRISFSCPAGPPCPVPAATAPAAGPPTGYATAGTPSRKPVPRGDTSLRRSSPLHKPVPFACPGHGHPHRQGQAALPLSMHHAGGRQRDFTPAKSLRRSTPPLPLPGFPSQLLRSSVQTQCFPKNETGLSFPRSRKQLLRTADQ